VHEWEAAPVSTLTIPWNESIAFDEEFDVIVAGYGFAGAVSAISAADAGARVLLVEKMRDPGGISICSHGAVCSTRNPDGAFTYLKATNAGRTPDPVLRALADGMQELEGYVRGLAEVTGAEFMIRERGGNYPLPGEDSFYYTQITSIPNFDAAQHFPQVRGRPGGPMVFYMLQKNVERRSIDVRLETPVRGLIAKPGGEVVGAEIETPSGERRRIRSRRGVILACGGFEGNVEMQRQYWQMTPVFSAANRGNTGDGIRMAQALGANLWHMWHFHGSYGFRHPDAERYPLGIRVKRFPDWIPGLESRAVVQAPWILVDQRGRRFMNEFPPYVQDTGARPFELFDPVIQSFPRIPAYMVFDELGSRRFPMGNPAYNDRDVTLSWSRDNKAEVESGILKRADTLTELAGLLGVDESALEATVARWNRFCAARKDEEFDRPGGTMMKIQRPPYYGAEIWPVLSNTQGGPEHDARQRIVSVEGGPIPRLFAAGEMGSSFGHLYLAGGNIAECFVTGRIAGREAAGLAQWG
jgi:succinate dehydrogenase/fumarate reductase flavoprotein subunit